MESRRGAVTLASRWQVVRFSPGRLSPAWHGSVSSSRSSNWTGAFRASSSRRKVHGFAHGKLLVRVVSWTRPQHLMQGGNWKLLGRPPSQLVLGAQPLSQPRASMSFDSSIGMTDWSQTEIIRPPNHDSIECRDYCFLGQKGLVPSGFLADRLTKALHPFLRRSRS